MTNNTGRQLPSLGVPDLARAVLRRPLAHGRIVGTLGRDFDAPALDPRHVERYNRELAFEGSGVALTYFYLLIQRAEFATLLSTQFGFRLPGMVHVENQLRLEDALDLPAPMKLRTAVGLEPPTERGAIYVQSIVSLFQGSRRIVSCRNRYLARRGDGTKVARDSTQPQAWPELATWRLPKNAGTAYASLSGDWNPIHLWPWSARLLGMRHPIIQGMHSVARTCAEIERGSGQSVTAIASRFRQPISIGSTVGLIAEPPTTTATRFAIIVGGTVAVTGNADLDSTLANILTASIPSSSS